MIDVNEFTGEDLQKVLDEIVEKWQKKLESYSYYLEKNKLSEN